MKVTENKIYLIDNYDSFTYNLVDLLYKFKVFPNIIKNDEKLDLGNVDKIIVSPGPSNPKNSGISLDVVEKYYKDIPVLGVCLGHQVIGEIFNCNVNYANEVMHGKVSLIYHKGKGIFKGIPSPFKAVRYHSLVIKKDDYFNYDELEIIAWTEKNNKFDEIMGIKHKKYNVFGVQFHPESILTQYGDILIKNFLEI